VTLVAGQLIGLGVQIVLLQLISAKDMDAWVGVSPS